MFYQLVQADHKSFPSVDVAIIPKQSISFPNPALYYLPFTKTKDFIWFLYEKRVQQLLENFGVFRTDVAVSLSVADEPNIEPSWCSEINSSNETPLHRNACKTFCGRLGHYYTRSQVIYLMENLPLCYFKSTNKPVNLLTGPTFIETNYQFFYVAYEWIVNFLVQEQIYAQLTQKLQEVQLDNHFLTTETRAWCDYSSSTNQSLSDDEFCIAACHVLYDHGLNKLFLKQRSTQDVFFCFFGPNLLQKIFKKIFFSDGHTLSFLPMLKVVLSLSLLKRAYACTRSVF